MTVPVLECYRSAFVSNSSGYGGKCNNPFKKLDHNIYCKDTFAKCIKLIKSYLRGGLKGNDQKSTHWK